MTLSFSMTGSGTVGELFPGWSIQKYAMSLVPGEYNGGTGGVNFNAKANDDSLLVVNNSVTSTVTDNAGASFAKIKGNVKSVSQSGLSASINHSSYSSIYDSTQIIPPLSVGCPHAAVDICSQIVNKDYPPTQAGEKFWSLQGHSTGFETIDGLVTMIDPASSDVENKVWGSNFIESGSIYGYLGNMLYSNNTYGWYDPDGITISFKIAAQASINFSIVVTGYYLQQDPYEWWNWYPVYVNENIYIQITPSYIVIGDQTGNVYNARSNQYGYEAFTTIKFNPYSMTLSANVWNFVNVNEAGAYYVGSKTNAVYAAKNIAFSSIQNITSWSNFYVSGRIRALTNADIWSWVGSSSVDYESVKNYVSAYSALPFGTAPVPSVEKNMWEYIQDACAVYGYDASDYINQYGTSKIIMRPAITTGSTGSIDISNHSGTPNISPDSSFSAKAVDIQYSNAALAYQDVVYDAYANEDNPAEVKVGETSETKYEVKCSIVSLTQPFRDSSVPLADGAYAISDNAGLLLPANIWEDYGGDLTVSMDTQSENTLVVSLQGPAMEIPGYTSPFKVAYTANGTEYAALKVLGNGVSFDYKKLTLQTGVDETKTSKSKSSGVENPFINTIEQAYDAGVIAATRAAGPIISFSVNLQAFTRADEDSYMTGINAILGSIIAYGPSKYRVVGVTVNNSAVSIDAVQWVNVLDFDSHFNGDTVSDYDTLVSGYQVQDAVVAPLI